MDIIFDTAESIDGNYGTITLNRTAVLNSITIDMITAITSQLQNWQSDNNIVGVIIKSNSEKAFSAGADLKQFYNGLKQPEIRKQTQDFFRAEYKLNSLIHHYPKPYIALLDGIAMGGGLGLSIHGSHVIASENLQLAMPETKIGFYPDIGASYFLARCPHNIGRYLSLTGESIGVADAMCAKLIDYYVPSSKLEFFLAQLKTNSLDQTLASMQTNTGTANIEQHIDIIEHCFAKETVTEILAALSSASDPFADKTKQSILARCPTSVVLSLVALQHGATKNLDECLEMEFNLSSTIIEQTNIYEGIRAMIIDKDKTPQWNPDTIDSVTDSSIKQMFNSKWQL